MSSSLSPGTKLGRYQIRSKIGTGGMGEVYLAEDTELGRAVAIKILPEAFASKQQRLQRFIQEAKAASALNHPHILTIYEVGTTSIPAFIATEFIDGETLRQRISAGMKLTEILEVAIQAAGALAAAHAAGIIHRDIKPENVMIRRDGYIKVLDFGLAKLTEPAGFNTDTEAPTRAMVNTGTGVVMGTANYMSPEQAKGTEVDARTDLWSLGTVLYEMVTGHVPFAGETPTETISLILQKEPSPLTRYAHEVPTELERIVSKALTKDPDERYQTAKDLLIDLRNLKRKIEVDAEIDRTVAPEFRGTSSTGSRPGTRETDSGALETTSGATKHSRSSADYIVSGIKDHKIATAIAIILLAISGIGIGVYMQARNTEVAIESIAVLPFENQNHDPNSDYLSDGLTESIINSLTHLPNLKVIARSSVFRYKGRETDPLLAGKDLGVQAVLTGRMMKLGDRLIVSSELLDVRESKQLWGDRYERDISDLLAMQRDIAQQITSNLRLKLSGSEQRRVTKHYTDNAEAYQLYLQGRFHWNRRTGEALQKSVEYFERAIEKDPNYALAYAGLADAYLLFPAYSVASPQESFPKAKLAARKALELDETLAEAHTSLGSVLYSYDWSLAESNREFHRALELNPNYATARQWYSDGNLLGMGRFDEALAEMKRAQELDPLSLIINAELGTIYLYARQYDKAIQQLQKTIEMDQSFYFAHWMLGIAYQKKGSRREAIAEFQKARELQDDPALLGLLGYALAESGNRNEAVRMLDELRDVAKDRYVPAYSFAIIYIGLGNKDQAFQWLEKGYQDHANELSQLKYDPLLDNLRSDSRFTDLVRRVGL